MKPYVVIIKQMQNNKIILSEQELRSMIERAYNDGYNDGNSYYWRHYNWPYVTNTSTGGITLNGGIITGTATDRIYDTATINNPDIPSTNTTTGLNIIFNTGDNFK